VSFACNSIGSHTVYAYASDPSTSGYEYKQQGVSVTDPPPSTCPQFDLIAAGTRVLTHKFGDSFGSTYTYPTGQSTDGEIPISLRVRAAPAGTVVYLKVIDPEDTAAYGTPHQKDDNIDTAGGTISGGKTTSVTLPASGTVSVVLKTTLHASGDNYQVQASSDPALTTDSNFVCSPSSGCQTTPVITAWKRMYVEEDEMYRESQLLAERSLVGASVVYVDARGFQKGNSVRLVHAPSYLRMADYDVDGFYSEDRTIVGVARNSDPSHAGAYAITLDAPLMKAYYRDINVGSLQLGDAIADLSAGDPLYHFSEQYLAGAFAEAFVDVVKTNTSGVGVPLYNSMTDLAMTYVGGKWFAARTQVQPPSNSGMVIAAATSAPIAPDPVAGQRIPIGTTSGTTYSYVWRQSIDDGTRPGSKLLIKRLDPNVVSGEVLVHEIAHQWKVNQNYPDNECTRNSYADGTKFCQGNGPQNSGQYGDGIVKFHYVGNSPTTADSEYIDIRKTGEPKP
jgi:hypothetical protein